MRCQRSVSPRNTSTFAKATADQVLIIEFLGFSLAPRRMARGIGLLGIGADFRRAARPCCSARVFRGRSLRLRPRYNSLLISFSIPSRQCRHTTSARVCGSSSRERHSRSEPLKSPRKRWSGAIWSSRSRGVDFISTSTGDRPGRSMMRSISAPSLVRRKENCQSLRT